MTTVNETTPGPWRAWKAPTGAWTVMSVYRGFQDMRTTAFIATCDCQGQPNDANARMMAAAPTMYAALKAAEKYLATVCDPFKTGVGDALVTVRAALAAAAGRDAEAKP